MITHGQNLILRSAKTLCVLRAQGGTLNPGFIQHFLKKRITSWSDQQKLTDIDPFTVFRRDEPSHLSGKESEVAKSFKIFFKVDEPSPTDFHGCFSAQQRKLDVFRFQGRQDQRGH